MQLRQTADMRFVNDAIAPRRARRHIPLPVEIVRHDNALGSEGGVITTIRLAVPAVKARIVGDIALHCSGAGID
ncbi:hypothetical protein PAFU01_03290 [Pantoea ananatis]|nr:hypothetical protein PAFU01_03290 [Pantoea ananatis]